MIIWGSLLACAIVKPVTVRKPTGAIPFAKANLTAWTPPDPGGVTAQSASKSSK